MTQAKQILAQERSALYDDATSQQARKRIAAVAVECKGESYKFADGSTIVFCAMSGSVSAY